MSWWNRQCIERLVTPLPRRSIAIIGVAFAIMIGIPLAAFAGAAALELPAATPVLPTSAVRPDPTEPSATATAAPEPTQPIVLVSSALRSLPKATASPTPTATSAPTEPQLQSAGASVQKVTAACEPTAGITGDTIDFESTRREDAGYPASTGTMELTITAAGADCARMATDWTIQVSVSAMDGPGDAVIPAGAISYSGTAPDTRPPAGIITEESPIALVTTNDSAPRIATGSALVENGATWDVALQVHPPDDTPPGIYTGKITVDIASGS